MYENNYLMMTSTKEAHDRELHGIIDTTQPISSGFVSHTRTVRLWGYMAIKWQNQKLTPIFCSNHTTSKEDSGLEREILHSNRYRGALESLSWPFYRKTLL